MMSTRPRRAKSGSRYAWRPGDLEPADEQSKPVTAEVILAEWYENTDDLAGPHLNRAAAALHAGDRMGAAGELELAAAAHGDGETGDRLCRMAISLAREHSTTGGRFDLSAESRAKAHATASATAKRDETRNARGEWTSGGDQAWKKAGLSGEERAALKTWAGAESSRIQKVLRDPDKARSDGLTAPEVPLIDSAIKKNTIPHTTLYRSLTSDKDPPADLLKPGSTFTDKGFAATSRDNPADGEMFKNYHHIIINVPAGTHGVQVPGPYNEVLLGRNTTLKVTKVETGEFSGFPRYDIYATVQPTMEAAP